MNQSEPNRIATSDAPLRKRISFVIPTLDQSGAERQLTLLATNLPADRYDVDVVALNRGGYFVDQLVEAGIPVTVLEKRFRFDLLTLWRLRQHLHRKNADIVQSFMFSANSYVRIPGVCPPQARILVSERCVDSWKSKWQLVVDRKLKNRMHCMTANSQSVADFYQTAADVPASRVRVIPNGLPDFARDEGHEFDLRKEFHLSPDTAIVGFAGRLVTQKCLMDLVWAFHLLQQVIDDVALVLVGEGPERDAMADLAKGYACRQKVFFTGHRPDAAQIIPQFDVFCLVSSFEGMSNSLMEAMASCVPAVVSDISSNRELISDNETGLVVPNGDGVAICGAIKRLLTEPELAQRVSTAAQQKIRQDHTVSKLVQNHRDLYEEDSAP